MGFIFTETKGKTKPGYLGTVGTIYDKKSPLVPKGYEWSLGSRTIGVDTRNYGVSVSNTYGFVKIGIGVSSEGITLKTSLTDGNFTEGFGMTYRPGGISLGIAAIVATRGYILPYFVPAMVGK